MFEKGKEKENLVSLIIPLFLIGMKTIGNYNDVILNDIYIYIYID